MTRNLSLCWHDHPNSLVSFLQKLVNGNSLFDCTLAAEGKYVKAHKVVLSACSPYFQLLFDQENDKNPIVILKDVQYECLKWVIDFVYLGEVQIRETQLKTFLEVARSLQIKGLDSSENGMVETRPLSTHSKTRGSNFQSMECGAGDEVIDVDNDYKVERDVDRIIKTSSMEQCRTPSPSQSDDVRCITIESAYSMAPSARSDPELDDSVDSEALEWSLGSAPPSIASSAPDLADTLQVNETQEMNNFKCYPNENSLAKDVLTEPDLEMEKRGVLCERNDHIEPKAQRKSARRRGRRASDSGRQAARAEGEGKSEGDGNASGSGVPPPGKSQRLGRKRRSLKDMPKTIACPLCPKRFARPTDFNVHNRRHTGERPYRCGTCHKRFIQASDLTRHMFVHTGERPFTCDACGKRFNRGSALKIHMRVHTGERPYACPKCDKTFAAHSQLWAHKRSHGAGKYTCDACGRHFKRKALVGHHWMRVHGPRPRPQTRPHPRVVVTKLDEGDAA